MSKTYLQNRETSKSKDLFYEYNLGAKPFMKWVGGKRQLIDSFKDLYPDELLNKEVVNYYEPFLGGGAVFFDIAQNYNIKNAYLYDINDELILTYLVIQNDVLKLIDKLKEIDKIYKKKNELQRKEKYYNVRKKFNNQREIINFNKYNEKWIDRAAQIIFLNRTCFNGLFRFNLKGEFNTPFGKYSNPKIVDEDNLLKVSKLLEIANIKKADYNEVKKDLNGVSSFVYFDPPYKPLNKSSNFTSYSKNVFNDSNQFALANLYKELHSNGYNLMLSNSDPKNINPSDDFFDELYKDYKITRVNARRSINSNPNKRTSIKEIVITNY